MKKLTEAAQAAKAIKQELKKAYPSVIFSVKSDNYSMGSSVDILYKDGPKCDDVRAITDKYQYGHFDGMQDMYINSNCNSDIPQAKFVIVSRTMSDIARFKIKKELNFADSVSDNDVQTHIFRTFQDTDFLIAGVAEVKTSNPARHQLDRNLLDDKVSYMWSAK